MLRAAERVPLPWKNGGGLTREVAVHPPGSDFAGFEWRVSIAEVRAAGPFSAFPGVDRSLAVLAGALSLIIAGREPLTLGAAAPPAHFPGELAVSAEPIGGAVTDLNVMTRRGHWRARMSHTVVHGGVEVGLAEATTLLLALTPLTLRSGRTRYSLARLDAALLEGPGRCQLESVEVPGALWVIELVTLTRQPPSLLDQTR